MLFPGMLQHTHPSKKKNAMDEFYTTTICNYISIRFYYIDI